MPTNPKPLISIIMPVYQGEAFIKRSIASVIAQTFEDWELVITDDASSDGSWPLLEQLSATDHRIRLFRHQTNQGQASARNTSLSQTRGQLVAYLDQDDEFYSDHLARITQWKNAPGVLVFRYDLVDDRPQSPRFGTVTEFDPAVIHSEMFNRTITVPLGVVHRRDLLDRVGLFNERLGKFRGQDEDGELWQRFAKAGESFTFVPHKSGRYHIRSDSFARIRPTPPDPDSKSQSFPHKESIPSINRPAAIPRLTILCPTTGRESLRRTLESVKNQLTFRDEFWLISDGPAKESLSRLWKEMQLPGRFVVMEDGPHRDWGHTPRNRLLPEVHDGYVLHIDDDDIYLPGALAAVRRAAMTDPGALFIFRMQEEDGSHLWADRRVCYGNVGTPMFIHPANIRLGTWKSVHGGDLAFVSETINLNPDRSVRWLPTVLTRLRPKDGTTYQCECPFPPPSGGPKFDLGGIGKGSEWKSVNVVPPADVVADFTNPDSFILEDRSVEAFRMSHALEHVPAVQYSSFLRALRRKLRPGGRIEVIQSDTEEAIRQYVDGKLTFRAMRSVLFTPPDRLRENPFHQHHGMWSAKELAEDFRILGFHTKLQDAGSWSFDHIDELKPEDTRACHGVPIKNLGVTAVKPVDRIPNQIHFIFGLRPDFGGRPFGLVHYLAVRSAAMVNRPDSIRIWYAHRPSGRWWDEAIRIAEPCLLKEDFAVRDGIPRDHYAHRADLARLEILREYGGIYLDMDVICVKPFGDLLQHSCVMGWEDSKNELLCNAVMLSEPNSEFVLKQLESQNEFRDGMWGEICIMKAGQLAHQFPMLLTTVPPKMFFSPSWDETSLDLLYRRSGTKFQDAVCHHLWEHLAWDRYLKDLTLEFLQTSQTNFAKIVQPFLP